MGCGASTNKALASTKAFASTMGSSPSKSAKVEEEVPNWIYSAVLTGDPSYHQFGALSSGMQLEGPCQVRRSRRFQHDTDAAMWKQGFTAGKHVFEIHFPEAMRGTDGWVGVGLEDTELYADRKNVPLVGHNRRSWGIGLRSRRTFHDGKVVKKYPRSLEFLPDKFYMYLDADSGVLQFGGDQAYYGTAHEGMPVKDSKLLYPMVATSLPDATITVIYRGQANMGGQLPPGAGISFQQQPPPPPPPQDQGLPPKYSS